MQEPSEPILWLRLDRAIGDQVFGLRTTATCVTREADGAIVGEGAAHPCSRGGAGMVDAVVVVDFTTCDGSQYLRLYFVTT